MKGPLLLDDVAHVLERHGGGVNVVLRGPVCRPDAAHLIFRLGEIVERQFFGQIAEAVDYREDGVVEVEEVGRRAFVCEVGRALDVV